VNIATAIAFAGSRLDRADHVRSDPERLAALRANGARLLRLDGLVPTLDEDGALQWGALDEAGEAELVFLGLIDGRGMFAAVPEAGDMAPAYASPNVWPLLGRMSAEDLATYGGARSLVDWHARHRFCGACGAATAVARAGWGRRCPECSSEHFPRTDPVVIMLAEYAGKVLVGRQPRYPARRYSALAGFVELGESVEEAVARELFEEAGVRATQVRYVASQPWPLPLSQLMIGCVAQVESDQLVIDRDELEDVIWVDRDGVRAALANRDEAPFLAPPAYTIANELLSRWARGE